MLVTSMLLRGNEEKGVLLYYVRNCLTEHEIYTERMSSSFKVFVALHDG